MCQGIYRNAFLRLHSAIQSYNFADMFFLHAREAYRSKTSWQNVVSVLNSSEVLFPIPVSVPQLCVYQMASNCKKTMPKFFEFPKSADDGPSGASRSSKTCPVVPNEFRVAGCRQEIAANHFTGTRNTHGLTGNVG